MLEGDDLERHLNMEFSQDPLFKIIIKMGLDEELFDEKILALNIGSEYSTTNIEEWYCDEELTGPTMRHWQKQLNEYLETSSVGGRGNVRMNYKAVFRLRMALLLRKNKVSLQRICQYVGIKPIDAEQVSKKTQLKNMDEVDLHSGSKELEVFRNLFGQMVAVGLVEVKDNMPMLKINEYVSKIVENQTQHLTDASRILELPDPELERQAVEAKIENLRNDLEFKFRSNEVNSILTYNKVRRVLEDEALGLWMQKPVGERFIKVGLFKRNEDIQKRDQFIREYCNVNLELRVKKEYGIE